jgi:hypothetical protein
MTVTRRPPKTPPTTPEVTTAAVCHRFFFRLAEGSGSRAGTCGVTVEIGSTLGAGSAGAWLVRSSSVISVRPPVASWVPARVEYTALEQVDGQVETDRVRSRV